MMIIDTIGAIAPAIHGARSFGVPTANRRQA